jgi:hypothetical protein
MKIRNWSSEYGPSCLPSIATIQRAGFAVLPAAGEALPVRIGAG